MMGWGWGGGAWMLLGLLLFVVLVVGAVVAVVLLAGGGAREHPAAGPQAQGQGWSGQPPHSEAERILEERFARGEIDAEALASGREALRRR